MFGSDLLHVPQVGEAALNSIPPPTRTQAEWRTQRPCSWFQGDLAGCDLFFRVSRVFVTQFWDKLVTSCSVGKQRVSFLTNGDPLVSRQWKLLCAAFAGPVVNLPTIPTAMYFFNQSEGSVGVQHRYVSSWWRGGARWYYYVYCCHICGTTLTGPRSQVLHRLEVRSASYWHYIRFKILFCEIRFWG